MAYRWMGMGEALGAAALTPNNQHQFALRVAALINLYPPRCLGEINEH